MDRISKNIRFLRGKTNLNQAQLADKLGFKRSTYATFESGRAKLTVENLVKISNYYRISVDDIIKNDLSNIQIHKLSKTNYSTEFKDESPENKNKNFKNKYTESTCGLHQQNSPSIKHEHDPKQISRLDLEQIREELQKLKKDFKESIQLIEQKNMEHALFGVLEALESERKYSACLEDKIKQMEKELLRNSKK